MEVTGPISTLPGKLHKVPKGTYCDNHPDVPAYSRVQGETDSFGCEMNDMCSECYNEYQSSSLTFESQCDWCNTISTSVRPYRDWEEGSCGPVYQVCLNCRLKHLDSTEDFDI